MRIFEIMSPIERTITPASSAEDAWQLMQSARVSHLVVKDKARVVGIVSESDLGGRSGTPLRVGVSVRDLMNPEVVQVKPQDTVRKAANLMRTRGMVCLPVVDRGEIVGQVTIADMLGILGHGVDRPAQPARAALHYRVPHRRARAATGRW
jgi:CBS-domain-containing membrane protein